MTGTLLLHTLAVCCASGETVTVQSPFEEDPGRLIDVSVIAIDQARKKFQIKRVGDDVGKWFSLRHILGITLRSGEKLTSPEGEAYWKEIQSRRAQKAEWRDELAKPNHVPDESKAPYGVRAQVFGDSTCVPASSRAC